MQAPIGRPEGYPAHWPEISTAGAQQEAWEGRYVNWGDWTPRSQPPYAGGITTLLPNSNGAPAEQTVSLRVELKHGRPGNSASTYLFVGSGNAAGCNEQKYRCSWLKHGLLLTSVRKERDNMLQPYYGSEHQQNIFLIKAEDGSLIARVHDVNTQVAVMVPWLQETYSWARFEKRE